MFRNDYDNDWNQDDDHDNDWNQDDDHDIS